MKIRETLVQMFLDGQANVSAVSEEALDLIEIEMASESGRMSSKTKFVDWLRVAYELGQDSKNPPSKLTRSILHCNHANECPHICPCPDGCPCRSDGGCSDQPTKSHSEALKSKNSSGALLCDHANESPRGACNCAIDCYCKVHGSCKNKCQGLLSPCVRNKSGNDFLCKECRDEYRSDPDAYKLRLTP